MDHLPRWRELVNRPAEQIPLDETALIIAAMADPTLDIPTELGRLDTLASQIHEPGAEGACSFVFETLSVEGDRETYDNPENSYLNRVIDRRRGIPISISVLLMELARRRGVTLQGVGMPGHFLVRDPSEPGLLINAFDRGSRLDYAACSRLLRSVLGDEVELNPRMVAPIGTVAILFRMLSNLRAGFERRNDQGGLLWTIRLSIAIPGIPPAQLTELVNGLVGMGRIDEASAILEGLASEPGIPAEAAQLLRARSRGLLAPFN
jgi:regulator of sirC expression with transglutaminase-like and TPR domain